MEIIFDLDEAGTTKLMNEPSFVVVLPYTDSVMAVRTAKLLAKRAMCDGVLVAVRDDERSGFVCVANTIFRTTKSNLFGYVAQDAFAGREWGKRVQTAFQNPKYGLLGFNDGKWAGLLASFGVVRRIWSEQNYGGDLFFHGYKSHYADVELTLLAIEQGAYIYDPNCVMVEIDYEKDEKEINQYDQAVFSERKSSGFDQKIFNERLISLFS